LENGSEMRADVIISAGKRFLSVPRFYKSLFKALTNQLPGKVFSFALNAPSGDR
jgi:hypothetical protein